MDKHNVLGFIDSKHKFLQKTLPDLHEKYKFVVDIGLPLMLVNKLLSEQKEKVFTNKYNITPSEFDVLMSLLCIDKPLSPTLLYENMIFSSGGMTKLLKKLEKKNLIIRVPSQKDKRSMLVALSDEGKRFVLSAFEDIANVTLEAIEFINEEEKIIFAKILKKILLNLTNSDD
ncbi:MAG: MarR family transcriptional regulator [Arcobacter butzleri]|jgi:DNA-binding MarR family transcriptional regulator|nr:MarR family transcriptional regulator [Arcobacteraceae bacterium]NLO18053.1 MarR family transcriptional regulator [Aliarcobacter butzleri]